MTNDLMLEATELYPVAIDFSTDRPALTTEKPDCGSGSHFSQHLNNFIYLQNVQKINSINLFPLHYANTLI